MTTRSFRGGLTGLRFRQLISFLRRNRLHATAHAYAPSSPSRNLDLAWFNFVNQSIAGWSGRRASSSTRRTYVACCFTTAAPPPRPTRFASSLSGTAALRPMSSMSASLSSASWPTWPLAWRAMWMTSSSASTLRLVHTPAATVSASSYSPCIPTVSSNLLHFYSSSDWETWSILDNTWFIWINTFISYRASTVHRRTKHKLVQVIMDLVAKCPELQAKARLPRCTNDPAYNMSLGPRYIKSHFSYIYAPWSNFSFLIPLGWQQCSNRLQRRHKNKIGRIPANLLARSFLQHR